MEMEGCELITEGKGVAAVAALKLVKAEGIEDVDIDIDVASVVAVDATILSGEEEGGDIAGAAVEVAGAPVEAATVIALLMHGADARERRISSTATMVGDAKFVQHK